MAAGREVDAGHMKDRHDREAAAAHTVGRGERTPAADRQAPDPVSPRSKERTMSLAMPPGETRS